MADALHQVAVTGDNPGAVIDQLLAEARGHIRSASAMPTAVARPWPKARSWSRCRGFRRIPDGRRRPSATGGTSRSVPCPCRHGRSDATGHRAASSHGRRTARSGRGPAISAPRRRTCGTSSTARWRRPPCPSAGRGGRNSPSRPRRSRGRG